MNVPPPPPPPLPAASPPPSSGYGQPVGAHLPPPPPPPGPAASAGGSISSSSLSLLPADVQSFWQLAVPTSTAPTISAEIPAPRAPMSGNQKLAWIGVAVALVIGAGAYWGFQYLHRYPAKEEVSRFLSQQLAAPGQKVVEVTSKPAAARAPAFGSGNINSGTLAGFSALANYNALASAKGVVQLDFVATLELTEALYERVSTDQYIQQQGADAGVFRKIQLILNGPNAAKLRDLAGIYGQVEDFNGKTLVREETSKGHRYTSSGIINALRQGGQWQMALGSVTMAGKDAPVGYKSSFFKGEVLSLSQADQAKKINDLISQAGQTLQKLQEAQQQYRANQLAAQQAAVARQQRATTVGALRVSGPNPSTQGAIQWTPPPPVARADSYVNIVAIPPGTVIEVTTQQAVDTSNLQGPYGAATAADIRLPGGTRVSKGSLARLTILKVGDAVQMRLGSLVVNGAWVPLNTDSILLGTAAQGGPSANQNLLIDAGKSYKFHQL